MTARYDRRTFLRRAGSACLTVPAVTAWAACVPDRPGRSERTLTAGPNTITRPVLLPWSFDAVRIAAPPPELPVTYVSMGRRQIYIDYDFRESVYWELRAHISVSTGVWRIPLPGDPLREPIQPGDEAREFEELSIRDWDATLDPALGDMRILRGALSTVGIDFSCASISGGGAFFQGGPWSIRRCRAPGEGLCREDFMEIGEGTRYVDRECGEQGRPVRFLTWAGREAGATADRAAG